MSFTIENKRSPLTFIANNSKLNEEKEQGHTFRYHQFLIKSKDIKKKVTFLSASSEGIEILRRAGFVAETPSSDWGSPCF